MPAVCSLRAISKPFSMKRPGLSRPLVAATLFLAAAALRAEETAPAKPAGPPLSPSERELVKRYDKNGDGRLDAEELAAAHEAMRTEAPMRGPDGNRPPGQAGALGRQVYQRLLQTYDQNRDGHLDAGEQTAAVESLRANRPEIYQALLQRFDVNGDGKFDAGESAAMFDTLSRLPPVQPGAGAAAAMPGAPDDNKNLTDEQRLRLQRMKEAMEKRRAERQQTATSPAAPAATAAPKPPTKEDPK